jgi:hypothetical protein
MTDDDPKVAKVAKEFYCDLCYYKCIKKTNFYKHLTTEKHKKRVNDDQIRKNDDQKVAKVAQHLFTCECGKKYKYKQGLSVHKKKCNFILGKTSDSSNNPLALSDDVVLKLLNDNQELRNIIVHQQEQIFKQQEQFSELIPKASTTINNTINNNQKFNINVFLNEKCRDALNITDFIKSIKISIEQLDAIKTTGMMQGLSSAIMTNLNSLSVYERPIHCTDIKRETLYIKDDNQWECDRDKTRIKTAIKQIAGKPYAPLQEWIVQNPDFKEVDEKQDYVANVLSTIGKPIDNIDKKIIKNVCAITFIK